MKKMILLTTTMAMLLTGQVFGTGRDGGNGGDILI